MKNLKVFFILILFLQIIACKNDNKMKTIKRDNAEINYNLSGKGGTTLLFVHGSYINQEYWEEQVNFFKDKYTVVTMDLPGLGKSGKDRNDWSLDGFAEDVNTITTPLGSLRARINPKTKRWWKESLRSYTLTLFPRSSKTYITQPESGKQKSGNPNLL